MIHALDRVAIATPRLADAARAYAIVLGRSAREDEGSASFALTNVRLELVAGNGRVWPPFPLRLTTSMAASAS